MKTSTASCKLLLAPAALIAAFAAGTCSAGDPSGEQSCADRAPTQTYFLADPNGNAFQLVYLQGCGWKYVAGTKSPAAASDVAFRQVRFPSTAATQAKTAAAPIADPLSVFIDGPTGYAFAWTPDTGWKFIGHIIG